MKAEAQSAVSNQRAPLMARVRETAATFAKLRADYKKAEATFESARNRSELFPTLLADASDVRL